MEIRGRVEEKKESVANGRNRTDPTGNKLPKNDNYNEQSTHSFIAECFGNFSLHLVICHAGISHIIRQFNFFLKNLEIFVELNVVAPPQKCI